MLRLSAGGGIIQAIPQQSQNLSRIGVFLLCLLPLAVGALALADVTLDDAYISYRYAENLAAGVGLVFNPGERVEGFSNPLWVLLLAVLTLLGISAPVGGKLLGTLAAVGALLGVLDSCRRLGLSRLASMLAGLWLTTSAGVVFYASAGMETPLLLCELAWMAAFLLAGSPLGAGLCAAAAAVTRPEGILYILPVVVWVLAHRRWRSLPVLLLPVFTLGSLALLRLEYFGSLLPNTFHAKIGDQASPWSVMSDNIPFTLRYAGLFVRQQLAVGLPLLLVIPAVRRSPVAVLPLLTMVFCAGVFCLYAGDDWMAFGRFCLPALPAVVVLMAAGADASGRWRSLALLTLGLSLLPGLWTTTVGAGTLRSGAGLNPANHSRSHAVIGEWLAENGRDGDRVVVNEIGAIGYYSKLPITDLLGLIDPVISGLSGRDDLSYPEYVLAELPRFVLLNDLSAWKNPQMLALQQPLRDKMRDSGLYARRMRFPLDADRALVLFEALPDAPPGPGDGLLATYTAPGVAVERIDAMVNFHWQESAPAAGLPVDGFSARWQGCLTLNTPRTVIAGADDGMTIWLDGVPVVENPTVGARAIAASAEPVAPGTYRIEVRYQDRANAAWAMLAWSTDGARPVAIPWTALSPPGSTDCP